MPAAAPSATLPAAPELIAGATSDTDTVTALLLERAPSLATTLIEYELFDSKSGTLLMVTTPVDELMLKEAASAPDRL